MRKGRLCPLREPSRLPRASPAHNAVSSVSLPAPLSELKPRRAAVNRAGDSQQVGITQARGSKTDQKLQIWLLGDSPAMFSRSCYRLAGAERESATNGGMWEPALPARLWAAPGEGKAARSAPATSHLVNAINNVSSALRTSFSQAGGEFAKLQLGTGPEPPRTSVDALAAAPKHRGGSLAPKPSTHPCSGCPGATDRGTITATARHSQPAHGDSGLLLH